MRTASRCSSRWSTEAGSLHHTDRHPVRVICGTREPATRLAQAENFDKDLYYRLAVLPIVLPPLRERPEDIAPLAEWSPAIWPRAIGAGGQPYVPRHGAPQPLFVVRESGRTRAVLTRTVALSDARPIDADDLLFGFGRTTPRPANAAATAGFVATAARTDSPRTVDLVINELAHEFKNPLVTIKTLAQHLEHLLADQSGHADVARLAGEAVDQMDQVLENLLQFTRFHAPSPDTVGLKSLLTPSLTALAPQLQRAARHAGLPSCHQPRCVRGCRTGGLCPRQPATRGGARGGGWRHVLHPGRPG